MKELTSLALQLTDTAGEIARKYYRQPFSIDVKSADQPVTIADREIERTLRDIIEKERPQDGIFGEEYGIKPSQSGLNWIIDPIDGTKSFMIGRPTFGVLVALWEGQDTNLLGIIDQPILHERWLGIKGTRTTFNGTEVSTRACPKLSQAISASTSPAQISHLWPDMYKETKAVVWGGDCYFYGCLVEGRLDLVIEAGLSDYDFAPMPTIIEGAGGVFCDWEGNPAALKMTTEKSRMIAVGDPALKDQALAFVTAS